MYVYRTPQTHRDTVRGKQGGEVHASVHAPSGHAMGHAKLGEPRPLDNASTSSAPPPAPIMYCTRLAPLLLVCLDSIGIAACSHALESCAVRFTFRSDVCTTLIIVATRCVPVRSAELDTRAGRGPRAMARCFPGQVSEVFVRVYMRVFFLVQILDLQRYNLLQV